MTAEKTAKHWNYRVIKHHSDSGEYFEIHEVYYDHEGTPVACTESGVAPYGESTEELSNAMIHMQSALTQPVLDITMFANTNNSSESINRALNMIKKDPDV